VDPGLLDAITKLGAAGGFAFMVWAFLTGRIVPGYLYVRERDRADAATVEAEHNAAALAALSTAVQELTKNLRAQSRDAL
jgi:hypothetical protein